MVPKGTMAVCGLRPALESWELRRRALWRSVGNGGYTTVNWRGRDEEKRYIDIRC